MKRTWIAVALLAAACATPTEPTTPTKTLVVPITHNLRATMETGEGGMDIVVYVCATQPRLYCDDGARRCEREVDHYISRGPCPEEPIR